MAFNYCDEYHRWEDWEWPVCLSQNFILLDSDKKFGNTNVIHNSLLKRKHCKLVLCQTYLTTIMSFPFYRNLHFAFCQGHDEWHWWKNGEKAQMVRAAIVKGCRIFIEKAEFVNTWDCFSFKWPWVRSLRWQLWAKFSHSTNIYIQDLFCTWYPTKSCFNPP